MHLMICSQTPFAHLLWGHAQPAHVYVGCKHGVHMSDMCLNCVGLGGHAHFFAFAMRRHGYPSYTRISMLHTCVTEAKATQAIKV